MEHFYNTIFHYFDYEQLYTDIVKESNDGAHFVEIGSFLGGSAAFMAVEIANSGKNIRFDCIDTFESNEGEPVLLDIASKNGGNYFEVFKKNIEPVKDYITIVKGSSFDIHSQYEDESLDFVMIDGDHRYESVVKDIYNWFPKVKIGGILSGHDFGTIESVRIAVADTIMHKQGFYLDPNSVSWIYRKNDSTL